jgi:glycine betaine/proline transport system substrate-binding protein
MKTLFRAALGAIAIISAAAMPAGAEDKTIGMGTMNWEDLMPISLITKRVLEDAGYTVKLTNFSEWGIAYAALSKGDAQILVSQTDYVAHDYWNRNKNKLEKLSPVSHGLRDFIAVPKYVTIDSLDQVNGVADKFGGKIIGIEPGAGEMREVANAIKDYGLKLQLVEGSTAAMTAALQSALDRKEWIAVTLWEPSWMAQKFAIKGLSDPKGDFAPPQTYYWIAQKGFAESHPHAREIIASVYLPLADDNAINSAVKDGKTMDQAVDDWMKAHADLIKRWESIKKD